MPASRKNKRPAPFESPGEVPGGAGASQPGELGFAQITGALQGAIRPPSGAKRARAAERKPPVDATPSPAPPVQPGAALPDRLGRAERAARSGQIEEAIETAQECLRMLEAGEDLFQLGVCHHVLALGHQYAGRMHDAMLAGYRAIDLLERADIPGRLVSVLALQALILARLGEFREALELLERATQLLPRLVDQPRDTCIFWSNAGATYYALGQLQRSVEAAEDSIKLLDRFDDPDLAAICMGNLLVYRVELARCDGGITSALARCIHDLQEHIGGLEVTGHHHLVVKCVETAGDTLIDLGWYDEARALLRRGVRSAQQIGSRPARGALELRLAHVERLCHQYRAAGAHIASALELLAEGHDKDELARTHLENCLLHEAQCHWRAALECHKRHAEIREALLKSQANNRAQAMAVRLDLERSRVETALLRQRNSELENRLDLLHGEAGSLKSRPRCDT